MVSNLHKGNKERGPGNGFFLLVFIFFSFAVAFFCYVPYSFFFFIYIENSDLWKFSSVILHCRTIFWMKSMLIWPQSTKKSDGRIGLWKRKGSRMKKYKKSKRVKTVKIIANNKVCACLRHAYVVVKCC